MKNTLASLLLIAVFTFACSPKKSSDESVAKISKSKLSQVNLIGDIVQNYTAEEYNNTIVYTSVEIDVICDGKKMTATGKSDTLTTEQKNILSKADIETNVNIDIKFHYNEHKNDPSSGRQEKEMRYTVGIIE